MKRAYSVRLGCLVDAHDCDYEDCLEYEVVCEICSHKVFKGVRPGDPAVHYLSHYRADSPEARECEARVQARIAAEAAGERTDGHGQSLAARIEVLPTMLDATFMPTTVIQLRLVRRDKVKPTFLEVRAGAAFGFRDYMTDDVLRTGLIDEVAGYFSSPESLEKLRIKGDGDALRYASSLGLKTRKRWVADMAVALSVPQSAPALIHLATHAWAYVLRTWPTKSEVVIEDGNMNEYGQIWMFMSMLPFHVDSSFDGMVDMKLESQRDDPEAGTVGDIIASIVMKEMVKLLLLIDPDTPMPKAPSKRKPRPKRTQTRRKGRKGRKAAEGRALPDQRPGA